MVQCKACGRLGVTTIDGETLEASDPLRDEGQLPVSFRSGFGMRTAYPVCCANVKDFGGRDAPGRERLLAMLQEEHNCQEFVVWQPSLSPKDHLEMKILAEVQRRTMAWRTEDGNWQKQQEALAETRHQELRRDAKQDADKNRSIAVGSLIAAAVAALAAIVSAAAAWWAINHR